jgi:hypothetical protein
MKTKAKNCNKVNGKVKEATGNKKDLNDLDVLADLICLELSDDAKMLYPSRNGIIRELRTNINRLQSVLSGQDRKRLKNLSIN